MTCLLPDKYGNFACMHVALLLRKHQTARDREVFYSMLTVSTAITRANRNLLCFANENTRSSFLLA